MLENKYDHLKIESDIYETWVEKVISKQEINQRNLMLW